MEKKKRRYFPDEFKRQAVERVATSGLTIMDVAAELGVHETQLRRWIRQFGKLGTGSARRPTTQAQNPFPSGLAAEKARLKRELQRAQTERDLLKTVPGRSPPVRGSNSLCYAAPEGQLPIAYWWA